MAGQRKYPVELRERAVEMVRQLQAEQGGGRGAITQVARDLGIHQEALRTWVQSVRRWAASTGERTERTPVDKDVRIKELERRVQELERANSILKAASLRFNWSRQHLGGGG